MEEKGEIREELSPHTTNFKLNSDNQNLTLIIDILIIVNLLHTLYSLV